jgi:hypothetical protein
MAALAGLGLSTVGSLVGAGKQAGAAKSAAATQANAATLNAATEAAATNKANTNTAQNLATTQAAEQPYQAAGATALSQLSAGTANGGVFNSTPTSAQVMAQDPGYNFTLDQGQQSLERAEAAGGSVGSGGALKAGAQYASNLATQSYGTALNNFMATRQANYSNLTGIANYGQSANQTMANAGTAESANIAGTTLQGTAAQTGDLQQAANATSAGTIGQANAWNSALSGIGTAGQGYLASQGLSNPFNSGQSSSGYQDDANTGAANFG